MPDLPDGSTECDPFPPRPLPAAQVAAVLDLRLAEVPGWRDPDSPVRLGFAMTEPHPLAVQALQSFVARNANNVGVHTRFGEGTSGTRRLEREVVSALGGLMHADAADGYLTSGANEGTLQGLRIGRNALRAGGCRRIVVLTSALTHHSVAKAAEILDLEIRSLAPGPGWLLEPEALERALHDLEPTEPGAAPVGIVVVSTAGYYNTGLVDPIDRISALIGAQVDAGTALRFFQHVDAAHGGMILPFTEPDISFDFRNRYVHSMVLDPHKSGLMPYSCGVFLCRKGLLGQVAVAAPMSGFIDETVTGSRSGAIAAALWAVVFGLGADGYRAVFHDCMAVRDALAEAVRAADPAAILLPSPGNTVLVVGLSAHGGRLPAEFTERYRLVGNRLPWPEPDGTTSERLFHHLYAMPHLTGEQIHRFGELLRAAVERPDDDTAHRAEVVPGPPVPAELKTLRGSSACLRHLVVHPPQRRNPDDHPHGYSFHTFTNRGELGEQLEVAEHADRGPADGRLLIYAPDLTRPFANELFGVTSPERFSLEILDRNQQKLSLIGAAHFSLFENSAAGPLPLLLLNFQADGTFRSAEYKYGDRWYGDEVQVSREGIVLKIGKDARSIRRTGLDYSFSVDTSLEIRIALVEGAAGPAGVRVRQYGDPALARRRHLLRSQYRRFPNRFFDVVLDVEVGRSFTGQVSTADLLGDVLTDGPLLARSADLGLARVELGFDAGVLHTDLTVVTGPGNRAPAIRTSVALEFGAELSRALNGLPVGEPETLDQDDVVAWARRLYPAARDLQTTAATTTGRRRLATAHPAGSPRP